MPPLKVASSCRFSCEKNPNLTKEEIVKYLKRAKIDGQIWTDYGLFNIQTTAIKRLSRTPKEPKAPKQSKYFNY